MLNLLASQQLSFHSSPFHDLDLALRSEALDINEENKRFVFHNYHLKSLLFLNVSFRITVTLERSSNRAYSTDDAEIIWKFHRLLRLLRTPIQEEPSVLLLSLDQFSDQAVSTDL